MLQRQNRVWSLNARPIPPGATTEQAVELQLALLEHFARQPLSWLCHKAHAQAGAEGDDADAELLADLERVPGEHVIAAVSDVDTVDEARYGALSCTPPAADRSCIAVDLCHGCRHYLGCALIDCARRVAAWRLVLRLLWTAASRGGHRSQSLRQLYVSAVDPGFYVKSASGGWPRKTAPRLFCLPNQSLCHATCSQRIRVVGRDEAACSSQGRPLTPP